jgi:metal-responsive CopG/Arc/MetJ family transcriptional regulator
MRRYMLGTKIKLDKELYERCKEHALKAGYSSVEEFITHILEKELKDKGKISGEEEEEVTKRLRGLGYID